ncbi:hypothetical protein EBBID32_34060 [Sphingobium indicum BiD32]|uniref:Uncharacterized protein n=1 Tax=Sphingobium indicum BiD32 TaxID=1301087 RepID=N1MP88_9SPHN|nr:hypothetical protein EBBID32_34060 [Sphingobium indicum BiD32]
MKQGNRRLADAGGGVPPQSTHGLHDFSSRCVAADFAVT